MILERSINFEDGSVAWLLEGKWSIAAPRGGLSAAADMANWHESAAFHWCAIQQPDRFNPSELQAENKRHKIAELHS